MMKTVLVFGTFDLLHKGHDYFLNTAKKYGDQLVVIVARDCNVAHLKGARPHDHETLRLRNVQKHPAVNSAYLGYENWAEHARVLDDIRPQIICLGYDQHATIPTGAWKVVRLRAFSPKRYKSSLMRKTRN